MSNDESDELGIGEASALSTAISEPYKVLGDLANANGGIGVLGRNTAASGTTKGVEGRVDSSDGYGLSTPDDARIKGVVDTDETDFVVEAGTTATSDATNVVHGHASNSASGVGATIGGGGYDDGTTSRPNQVNADYGTVGGGQSNSAGGSHSTVAGGNGNTAHAAQSTVSGGSANDAYDKYGTIGGGVSNQAGTDDGTDNTHYATVSGGYNNKAEGVFATVVGGDSNVASGRESTVLGGNRNVASGDGSTILGGTENSA